MEKILIVDDDFEIADLVSESLIDEGFETEIKLDGQEAYESILEGRQYSLILLDIMMPNVDGLELCKKIRDKVTCPIIFMSAKNRTLDTMVALEIGGDDYIKKPFVLEELVARVRAHLRREKRRVETIDDSKLTLGDMIILKDRYEVIKGQEQIQLTTREFQLLVYLLENSGRVLSKEQIFNAVWGSDYMDIGTVNVNIKNLRDKIDKDNKYIKTVWGIGYKLITTGA